MANSGGGYRIPRENEVQRMNCWVPAAPNNVILSSNSAPIQILGNNLETPNWQQMLQSPNDHPYLSRSFQPLQDIDLYQQAGRNGGQMFRPNSFMALLGADASYNLDSSLLDESLGINRLSQDYLSVHGSTGQRMDTLGSNCAAVDPPWMTSQFVAQSSSLPPQFVGQNRINQQLTRPVIPNLNIQASADWIGSHSTTMPLKDQNHLPIASACKDIFQIPEDQFIVPSRRLEYDLNSPARIETEAEFSHTIEFLHQTSATKSQDNNQCNILELSEQDRNLSMGGDEQIRHTESGIRLASELPQVTVETSPCIISTIEKIIGNGKGERVIDLNNTPNHKAPKRRKHRPKVIREGKPKKTPKSETPKNPKSSEKPKRKYTRKSSLKDSEIQPSGAVVGVTGDSAEEPAAKSCRRTLSFEQQKTAEKMEDTSISQPEVFQQVSRVGFNLNFNNQVTERRCADNNSFQRESTVQMVGQDDLLPLIDPAHLRNRIANSIPQGSTINNPHSIRPPPTRTTTFQDLLSGNANSCGSMANVRRPNLNLKSQVHDNYLTEAKMAEVQSLQQMQDELHIFNQHTRAMGNFNYLNRHKATNIISHAMRHPPTQATTFQELLLENEKCAQNIASSRIVNGNQNHWRNCYDPLHRITNTENTGQLALQAINTHDNLAGSGQMSLYRSTQPVMITYDSVQSEARRSNRELDCISEQHPYHSITSINSSLSSGLREYAFKSQQETREGLSEVAKKRRTENMLYMKTSSAQNQGFAEIKSTQLQTNIGSNPHVNMRSSHFNPYPWMSYAKDISHSAEFHRVERPGNGLPTSSAAIDHSSKQCLSSEQHSYILSLQNRGKYGNMQASPSVAPASDHNLQLIPTKTLLLDSQKTMENKSGALTTKQYSRPTASGLLVKTVRREAPSGDRQAITTTLTNGSGKNIAIGSSVHSGKKGNYLRPPSSKNRGIDNFKTNH